MSRSIEAKEACPPTITATSLVTSDSSVHRSRLKSKRSCQQELHQGALYLLRLFKLHGISRSLFLPIRVAKQRKTNQGTTRESRRSPMAAMAMNVTSHIVWEWRCAYMYKCTLYDTTRFKAVMAMNLSELRS
jgi:hypothetical protein